MLAWHYTTGKKNELITQSGVLRPTDIGVRFPELPILWFSRNQRFEMSARKGILTAYGTYRAATVAELYEHGDGLFRYGYPADCLLGAHQLREAASMSPPAWKQLVKSAEHMGASPRDWMGTVAEIPVDQLVVQKMLPNLTWPTLQVKEAA